jgi:uncharacterized protein (TIGR00661 family)
VLVAPLDWGLGHASRCIPIITYLIELNCRVSVAGEGQTIELIKKEFPNLEYLELKGYRIRYPKKGKLFIPKIIAQIPSLIGRISGEHRWLINNQKEKDWDLVISDNRYGLHANAITTILITHQQQIITDLGKCIDRLAAKILRYQIEKFSHCWIPDLSEENSISGKLSKADIPPRNTRYIGPVSRLDFKPSETSQHLLVLLSGPEPQRSILEQLLIEQLHQSNEEILFVRGLPLEKTNLTPTRNIKFINYLDKEALSPIMTAAKLVICRSGYSSIMDLLKLKKKALLIPTPGQTEQRYLASRLNKFGWFYMQQQYELDVSEGISKALHMNSARPVFNFEGYKQALREMLPEKP